MSKQRCAEGTRGTECSLARDTVQLLQKIKRNSVRRGEADPEVPDGRRPRSYREGSAEKRASWRAGRGATSPGRLGPGKAAVL